MKKAFKIILFSLLCVCAAIFTLWGIYENITSSVKLDVEKLTIKERNIRFYNDKSELIDDNDGKTPEPVKTEDLPPYVPNAFIAVEDKRFYSHNGTDGKRIFKAFLNNLKSFSYKEGASTISQQLIKNTHLGNEKSIARKLCEIKLTRKLEKKLTKKQILEAYLNGIYFGNGAYGIENAAKIYFNKHAKDLTIKESAVLAALIKAPSVYSPTANPEKSDMRTAVILRLMKEQGFITPKQYEEAVSEKNRTLLSANDETGGGEYEKVKPIKNYYLKKVRDEFEEITEKNKISVYSKLNVYTYLDEEAEKIMADAAQGNTEDNNYTAILCDNRLNSVKAIVTTSKEWNLPPASTVKPWLIYAPAFEENLLTEATKILDEKTDFNGFYPTNNSNKYYGFISVKECIEKSLNIPAVKTAALLKEKTMKRYAKKFGIELNDGLGVALGGIDNGISLKKTTDIYSSFAKNGYFTENRYVKRIENEKGEILYKNPEKKEKIFSSETTFLINNCLYSAAKNGTARKISNKNAEVCAKTGTNGRKNGNYNAFCISYSPEYTLSVHIGNPTNKIMSSSVSGGTYPAIISSEIWDKLSIKHKISKFTAPENIIKIRLDKKSYDKDCTLFQGDDGEEFYFKKGFEPQPLPKTETDTTDKDRFAPEYDITGCILSLNIKDNKATKGADNFGADIYVINKSKKKQIGVIEKNQPFTMTLKENYSYFFVLKPFTILDGKKIYHNEITLPEIKYKHSNKIPTDDWWNR